MKRLAKLLADRKLTVELDNKAKDWLGTKGYDSAYGARPLKRVIQKYVQDPLAELILQGRLHDGDKVKITVNKDGLVINGQAVKQAA
jgi:ATP-dependent Clp protease ATP-binding subunit ClpB